MSTAASSITSHASSDASERTASSSVQYDHEPFETFKDRVLSLAQSHIWIDAPAGEILVDRLPGGGFNRIIGLTRQSQSDDKIQYILRLPRFDSARLDRDVAVLLFLEQHTHIPAPKVIHFDQTDSNPVLSPYMVQNRLPGADLYHTFPTLDHWQKCLFAKSFGSVVRQMLETRSCDPGHLALLHNDTKTTAVNPTVAIEACMFELQKSDALERDPKGKYIPRLVEKFVSMASALDQQGYLSQTTYSLAHLDLAPRNILVRCAPDVTEQTIISGILDWDSAVFGPGFMACAPPQWIWDWKDDEDEDERKANDDPPEPENRQLKLLFEQCAGQDYCRYAYDAKYRLARRLVRFAMEGIRSNEDSKDADAMFREWVEISIQ
ncbi:uncharacterized protein PG998_013229 [Apiospora kogelbergensis]|uniref:uncharacterized protein n=1 Tax=Apiospora kogelbergensis TaxID=1337665 RepID=UPI00312E3168